MSFGQLTKYNIRKMIEKSYTKYGGENILPDHFLKN